ncbi:hypothetical protein Aperf_G00000072890 [Anoplocephala perfoliata]
MTSEGNVFRDRADRWEALECILGRSGPLQRVEFEPSTEALMGFCNIDVIDMDTIAVSNLNRQFLFAEKDIGRSKAEVAAEFIMRRINTCKVTPHYRKIQDFGPDFYKQFDVVLCGLDSVIARRWINSMLASLVSYNEDGTPDLHSIIPLVDGGTEGFKGHVIVVLFGFTGCIECSLDLYPPQENYPLCTIAQTPRLPEHCVEFVRLLLWPNEQPFGPNVDIDGDSPEHLEWIYNRSCQRAKEYGIQGVNMRLVKGVVKRIIPAVASTNAVIASAIVTEAFKLVTLCYDHLKNYMNFADTEGIYSYRFQIERKPDCLVCNNTPKNLRLSPKSTLRDLVDHLKNNSELQMQSPTVMTVMNGANRTLFVDFDEAMKGLRENLSKSLEKLCLVDGQLLTVTDLSLPTGIPFFRNSVVKLAVRVRSFASRHLANFRHQLKYVTLAEEPFATSLPPNPPASLPPPLDPAPPDSIPWSSLNPAATLLIDTRSPSEYAVDHIRGAVNIPILSDRERAEVGTLFSSGNTLEARLRGARFACTNVAESLRPEGPLSRLLDARNRVSTQMSPTSNSPLTLLVYCARGGQRSMAMATILAELHCPDCEVACLAGGYRAWRRLLLRQLDSWPLLVEPGGLVGTLWVLSSLTGCGKTLLLEELENSGESVLNLERMAEHKGSMFGGKEIANSLKQRVFESRLHDALQACLNAPRIWTECESRSVGPICHLNEGFWRRLRGIEATKRIWLSASLNARVDFILREYSDWIACSEDKLECVLNALARYHSKELLKFWRTLLHRRDFATFVAEILEHHYDPLYRKSRGPMLHQFADAGLLHRVELSDISRAYFRREVVPQLLEISSHQHQSGSSPPSATAALFHF